MSRPWRVWRNTAYLLLMAVVIALVVYWWPTLAGIWREQALTFVGAIGIMICATLVQARNFLVFLDTEHSVQPWRFAQIWALSSLANYVAPLQPGIAVRVTWLAQHGVNLSAGLLATWRQLIVSIWISLVGLAVGLLLMNDPRGRWPAVLLGAIWVVAFVLRRLWLSCLDRLARPMWLAQRKQLLHRAATGITWSGLVGVVVQYALGTLVLYWVYSRFGASINLGQALLLACLVYVSSMISVLPGNFGVMEAIYMFGGHGFGLSMTEMGALALLLRVSNIACSGLLALCGLATSPKADKG